MNNMKKVKNNDVEYQMSIFDDNCQTLKDYEDILLSLLSKLNQEIYHSGYIIDSITKVRKDNTTMSPLTLPIYVKYSEWAGVKKELATNQAYKILLKKIRNGLYSNMVHQLGKLINNDAYFTGDKYLYMLHNWPERLLVFLTNQEKLWLKNNVTMYISNLGFLPYGNNIVIKPVGFKNQVSYVIIGKVTFEFSNKLIEMARDYLHKECELDTLAYYDNKQRRIYSFDSICDRKYKQIKTKKSKTHLDNKNE